MTTKRKSTVKKPSSNQGQRSSSKTTSNKKISNNKSSIKEDTYFKKFDIEIAVISLVVIGILMYIMALVPSSGYVSTFLRGVFFGVFGFGTFFIPIALFYYAVIIFKKSRVYFDLTIIATLIVFLIMLMTFIHLTFMYEIKATEVFSLGYTDLNYGTGGFIGALFGNFLSNLFGKVVSFVINLSILLVCIVLITRKSFLALTMQAGSSIKKGVSKINISKIFSNLFNKDDDEYDDEYYDNEEYDDDEYYDDADPVNTIEREMIAYKKEVYEREQEELERLRRMEKKYKKIVKKDSPKEKAPKIFHTLRKSNNEVLTEEEPISSYVENTPVNIRENSFTVAIDDVPISELNNVTTNPEELELLKRKHALEKSQQDIDKDLRKFYKNLGLNTTMRVPSTEGKIEETKKETTQRVIALNSDFFSKVEKPSKIYEETMKDMPTEDLLLANLYNEVMNDSSKKTNDEDIKIANPLSYKEKTLEKWEQLDQETQISSNENYDDEDEYDEEEDAYALDEEEYENHLLAIKNYKKENLTIHSIEEDTSENEDEYMDYEEEPKKVNSDMTLKQNIKQVNVNKPFSFPSMNIMQKGENNPNLDYQAQASIRATSLKLEETLLSFGVQATVTSASRGPSVTRYEVKPGTGVKVNKIANLSDDLALNLAAQDIRIQAPIPGKQAVGIEIPNSEVEMVYLRDIIDSQKFKSFPSSLAFGIGKDIAGNVIVHDIAKMPHLLVAGATGSGKSVCINTLITSILYKAKPSEVKLIMVDPKVVELSIYNGIPHLLIPVVTDPKKANAALQWAVVEMEKRFASFSESNVRNLTGYNQWLKNNGYEPLPSIVIIIDELADLMMTSGKEVEDSICRLAQKARAAGIHLIVATQRPSVDVITGLIKANIPSRLAFAVSSGIDSRTILDSVGAERLLGKGDMLFSPMGSNEPIRIQGAFISDGEVENIVEHLKTMNTVEIDEGLLDEIVNTEKKSEKETEDENKDALFYEAMDYLIERDRASTSMLQTKFSIGYNRASRLIENFESLGYIGEQEGSKPRKILLTFSQWEDIKNM
ncbi:MAG: DNA translocase FtsK 4TM domain-containing protein [Lachnospirales bacterium]